MKPFSQPIASLKVYHSIRYILFMKRKLYDESYSRLCPKFISQHFLWVCLKCIWFRCDLHISEVCPKYILSLLVYAAEVYIDFFSNSNHCILCFFSLILIKLLGKFVFLFPFAFIAEVC